MCDKVDSKSESVKTLNGILRSSKKDFFVVFIASGFRSVMMCSNLMMEHARRRYHALTQGIIKQLKYSSSRNRAAAYKITKKYKKWRQML